MSDYDVTTPEGRKQLRDWLGSKPSSRRVDGMPKGRYAYTIEWNELESEKQATALAVLPAALAEIDRLAAELAAARDEVKEHEEVSERTAEELHAVAAALGLTAYGFNELASAVRRLASELAAAGEREAKLREAAQRVIDEADTVGLPGADFSVPTGPIMDLAASLSVSAAAGSRE